jgi:hypothetical protein
MTLFRITMDHISDQLFGPLVLWSISEENVGDNLYVEQPESILRVIINYLLLIISTSLCSLA